MLRTIISACAFTMLALVTGSSAYAQVPSDHRTFVQFGGTVTLPGMTLPSGRYLFRILEEANNRGIVQVLSQDGKQVHATLVAIPVQRSDMPTRAELRFMTAGPADPMPVSTWWVPANMVGWEFVYPREQAVRLAKAGGQPVLTTAQAQNAKTDQLKTLDLARVSASGDQTAVTVALRPPATAVSGTPHPGELASVTLEIPASPPSAAGAAKATR
jgi:hypothetical protein